MNVRQLIPEDLADIPPGPELACVLAGLELSRLSGFDCVEVLKAQYRQANHERARVMAAMVEVGMCGVGPAGDVTRMVAPDEFSSDEVRAALVLTRRAAQAQFWLAHDLVTRLPQVHAAMHAGVLDEPRARVFSEWSTELSGEQARAVCATLLPRATGLTTGQLIEQIKKLAIAIDPDWARRRYEQAITDRKVVGYRNADGSANWVNDPPPPQPPQDPETIRTEPPPPIPEPPRVILEIPPCAREEIDAAALARGRGQVAALDGHRLLCQLKVATAFGILDQRTAVDEEDWQLTGRVLAYSDVIRKWVTDYLAYQSSVHNTARGRLEATRAVMVADAVEDAALARVARSIMRILTRADGWLSHKQLRMTLAARDRGYFGPALDHLLAAGQAQAEPTERGTQYRAVRGGDGAQ